MQSRSSVLNDLLRLSPTIMDTAEGKESLTLMTALISRLVVFASPSLERSFTGLIQHYLAKTGDDDTRILSYILLGCTHLSRNNGKYCLRNFLTTVVF